MGLQDKMYLRSYLGFGEDAGATRFDAFREKSRFLPTEVILLGSGNHIRHGSNMTLESVNHTAQQSVSYHPLGYYMMCN